MLKTTSAVFSALFLLCAASASADVTGSASFKGKAPGESALKMKSDPKCKKLAGKSAKTNDYKVAGGKLADVFVYVKNPPKKKYKAKGVVKLDQKGCRYSPKVFGVMVKQKIEIKNSDPTLHNIHPAGKRGNEFNVGMPTQNQVIKKKFKKEQVMVSIKCDVHPWMQAYAGVLKHPFFATTDASGKYSIAGLPDGEYDVVAWHAKLGEKTAKLKVSGGAGSADFTFSK